jgi:hypothetical protein
VEAFHHQGSQFRKRTASSVPAVAGETRVPLLFTWTGFVLVRILLAHLQTGARVGRGVYGAWLAMFADLLVRGAFFLAASPAAGGSGWRSESTAGRADAAGGGGVPVRLRARRPAAVARPERSRGKRDS